MDVSPPSSGDTPALRVLLVPDVPYWICNTIARAYAQHNPELDMHICSGRVLRAIPALASYIGQFDLVHFLTPHDANKSLTTFQGRVATVCTIHHIQDDNNTRSVAASDGVMTASTQWYQRLRALGISENKLAIVPYGVDTRIFRPRDDRARQACRAALSIEVDAFVVGFVGKRSSDVHGRKGTDVFIRGIRHLAECMPTLTVLIVGPGWEAVARDLSDGGIRCVRRPFVVGEEAFAEVYAAMDVYWCTSTIEGGPVPVLESMASGVCCLATDVGMVSDVISPGENGFILPFDDSIAFAETTRMLADHPEQRHLVAAAGARRIREAYDWAISARHVQGLYEQSLAHFARRSDRVNAEDGRGRDAWPVAWIAAEEAALTARFLHDASHPPSWWVQKFRTVRENRWVRTWMQRPLERKP